ncbi:MAG: carboxypeptidase regulatory-like domain-containing protein, partial [Acidobacteriaceae bacterium]|nr:carboxypeptidase regulatory-like domain-containing protein [Acidobacteriaceae bacterium]
MRHLGTRWLVCVAAVVLLALVPQSGFAQAVYGSIAGTVRDATGSVVDAVNVTLTNTATGETRSMTTSSSGDYTFVNILPGRYSLTAEKAGFKKLVREPIIVDIESGLRVDLTLEVGAVTQTVEVTAAAPLLQPETSSLGQVVEQRAVTELPLNGRNPLALVQLT